jgi:hypothetical protein
MIVVARIAPLKQMNDTNNGDNMIHRSSSSVCGIHSDGRRENRGACAVMFPSNVFPTRLQCREIANYLDEAERLVPSACICCVTSLVVIGAVHH